MNKNNDVLDKIVNKNSDVLDKIVNKNNDVLDKIVNKKPSVLNVKEKTTARNSITTAVRTTLVAQLLQSLYHSA